MRAKLRIEVSGTSMLPLLRSGDEVIVEFGTDTHVQPGVILLYKDDDGAFVLHRLLRAGDMVLVKGDNQKKVRALKPSSVVGRMLAVRTAGSRRWTTVDRYLTIDRMLAAISLKACYWRRYLSKISPRHRLARALHASVFHWYKFRRLRWEHGFE